MVFVLAVSLAPRCGRGLYASVVFIVAKEAGRCGRDDPLREERGVTGRDEGATDAAPLQEISVACGRVTRG